MIDVDETQSLQNSSESVWWLNDGKCLGFYFLPNSPSDLFSTPCLSPPSFTSSICLHHPLILMDATIAFLRSFHSSSVQSLCLSLSAPALFIWKMIGAPLGESARQSVWLNWITSYSCSQACECKCVMGKMQTWVNDSSIQNKWGETVDHFAWQWKCK